MYIGVGAVAAGREEGRRGGGEKGGGEDWRWTCKSLVREVRVFASGRDSLCLLTRLGEFGTRPCQGWRMHSGVSSAKCAGERGILLADVSNGDGCEGVGESARERRDGDTSEAWCNHARMHMHAHATALS